VLKSASTHLVVYTPPSTMGKSKSRFTLVEKEEIVAFAFSIPDNIKATGRLYSVQPANIRYWAKSHQAARTALSPSTFKISRSRLSLCQGKSAKHHESDNALYKFMQNMREQQLKVTVRLMCAEYKRLNTDDSEMSNFVIRRRIYRWMRRKKVSLRRVTHKAQNSVHHVECMRDWVRYVLGQIKMLDIPYENVANFDETNLDFSVEGGQTLNAKGAKTVGVKGGQSSDRATAFIGVSMMGECFTPYIIYKGTENKMTG
jgi:transposase-like protein